ncbi:MAG: AI-2E family transporter, partial [Actinomycetota bacterium]|nr:AI-2E family transporter [Actinomycetota bacterium]
ARSGTSCRAGQRDLTELQEFLTSGPFLIEPEQIDAARDAAVELLQGEAVRASALEGATAAAEAVAGLFLVIVVLFFLLKDGARI